VAQLSLRHVSKRFGRQLVIDDVSLDIGNREFAVVVGPSGCGKSTLLRLIAGLEAPTTGEIWIGGECVTNGRRASGASRWCSSPTHSNPHMSVYENIAFGLRRSSFPGRNIDEQVRKTAERLQIGDLLARKPKELSGGQRQRVAIVREPRVFLFDEPLSNLDASLRTQMRLEFMGLHRELGATTVYVTHDQAEAMTLGSVIVVLRHGRVEQIGSPLQVYDRPANRFVAGFIGSPSMNMIEGRLEAADDCGAHVTVAGSLRLLVPVDARRSSPGAEVVLGVRPEHLHRDPTHNALDATVVAVERLGSESLLHARLSTEDLVTWHAIGSDSSNPGDTVILGMDAARCHLFDGASTAFTRLEASS
jgi:multiple sugar transport system ATP-binding protein